MTPIYSIIIPHKNIPHLLKRCLVSIPERTDTEIIIVDDNSDSSIVDFDNFPGVNRSDVTILYDKSGKGAGRARNIGLQHAVGKWILFADADDYFTYCFSNALDDYKDDVTTDIVFFKALSTDSDEYIYVDRVGGRNKSIDDFIEGVDKQGDGLRYFVGSPWSKFIKKKLIEENEICFAETCIHNDTKFSYLTGHYAKSIKADKRAIYCATYRLSSMSYTLTDEKYLDRMRVMGERHQFFLEHGISTTLKQYFLVGTLREILNAGNVNLYDKCVDILAEYGIKENDLKQIIFEIERYERRCRVKQIVKEKIKHLIHL